MTRITRLIFAPLTALLVAAVAACSPGEEGVSQAQLDDPVIVLSEGACLGTCPVYDVTLRPDGAYLLNSVRFVKLEGVSEGNIGADAWADAESVLNAAGFWKLKPIQTMETLANCQTDAPTVKITWRTVEGKQKTVTYNAGCGVRKMNDLISQLRAATQFDDLVWTNERFNPVTGDR